MDHSCGWCLAFGRLSSILEYRWSWAVVVHTKLFVYGSDEAFEILPSTHPEAVRQPFNVKCSPLGALCGSAPSPTGSVGHSDFPFDCVLSRNTYLMLGSHNDLKRA